MMIYPNWTPASIISRIKKYEEILNIEDGWKQGDKKKMQREADMWQRLAARPEMESVWIFIAGIIDTDKLTTNGGLVGSISRDLNYFYSSPRLSPKDYGKELQVIAKMAGALSNKLKKFCDAESVHNPFPYRSIFNTEQLDRAKRMAGAEGTDSRSVRSGFFLDFYLPPIDAQLRGLADRAKTESENQDCRLRLPRKINDENFFRTYFIQLIGKYFFANYADYSPSRISIFCSVALDDPEITPDLVRKIYQLDDECRAMLAEQKEYFKSED